MRAKQFQIEDRLGLRHHFGSKPGSPPPPPKPPMPTDAAANVNAGNPKKPKGYSSTFLSGPQGVQNQTSKKTFLGG